MESVKLGVENRSYMRVFFQMVFLCILAPNLLRAGSMTDAESEFTRFNYQNAISIYESLIADAPNNADLLWRLSRVYVCLGDVSAPDQQEMLYRQAEKYARACIAADDSKSQGHAWLAASLGSTAMFVGSKTKVALSREIKVELDRALSLNPNDDVALTILGSFHRALSNVSWIERQLADLLLGGLPKGGFKEGEAAFLKAIALSPTSVRHRFELAMLCREAGQTDRSNDIMREAVTLRPQMLSDFRRIEQMKAMLAEQRP